MPEDLDPVQPRMDDAVYHALTVPVPVERAFAVFVDELGAWWPPAYTWSRDVLDTIAIEPHEGGRCFERGPRGFECDWGRVLACEAPNRLVFTWQIDPQRVPEPNPARASEVEVRFEPEDPETTRVDLVHRHFDHHGEGAAGYREAMGSEQGWPYILSRYAKAVRG